MFMVFVFLGNITFNINALQQENTNLIFWINGTVRVISSEPPCKNSNVRFANVPLILCLIKCVLDIFCFCFFKLFLFIIFLRKWLAYFLLIRIIVMENIQNETLYEYLTIFFFYQIMVSKVPLEIGYCPLCMEGHLKLNLQPL